LQSGCGKAGPSNSEAAQAQKPEPTKDEMIELGRQHKTAADLFRTLRVQANGGHKLTSSTIPDWTGVYTRTPVPGFAFDPDQPANGSPTAKLTPEFQAKFTKRMEDLKKGIEWDPISTCSPPGHPRWLTEPFLREFVVTPDQTWLINEMVNDIRRIYTDGRDHVAEVDRYPLYDWRLDRFLGRIQTGHSHQPAAVGHLPARAAGLHGPSGDCRDLAED
jgi:hypothetical protein